MLETIELFVMARVQGATVSKTSLKRRAGRISMGDVVGFKEETISQRAGRVIGANFDNREEQC